MTWNEVKLSFEHGKIVRRNSWNLFEKVFMKDGEIYGLRSDLTLFKFDEETLPKLVKQMEKNTDWIIGRHWLEYSFSKKL